MDPQLAAELTVCPFRRYRAHEFMPGIIPSGEGFGLHHVADASSLFQFCRSLCRTGGSWLQRQRAVNGDFRLVGVQAVRSSAHLVNMYIGSQAVMNQRRQAPTAGGGAHFSHDNETFSDEQYRALSLLRNQFHEKPPGTSNLSVNTVYCFHGPRVENLEAVCETGLSAVRVTDAGYFGSGCYTTLNIEYALHYAYGLYDTEFFTRGPRPSAGGRYPVIMFAATVGMAYPVTRTVDYGHVPGTPPGFSDFFGRGLKPSFDCHVVCVNERSSFQAVPRAECEYVELVIAQESQLLPVAVLWFERD